MQRRRISSRTDRPRLSSQRINIGNSAVGSSMQGGLLRRGRGASRSRGGCSLLGSGCRRGELPKRLAARALVSWRPYEWSTWMTFFGMGMCAEILPSRKASVSELRRDSSMVAWISVQGLAAVEAPQLRRSQGSVE